MYKKQKAPSIVDSLLVHAVEANASDIHLESTQQALRTRFRIDGILYDQPSIEKEYMQQVIGCIKVRAHINTAEKRIPQDGKFHLIHNEREIDLRVSCFPSLYGETVVIRILDRSVHTMSLDALGFDPHMLEQFKPLIQSSQGFFLVAGPTGSGKTTTLYASLAQRNQSDINIITLEDPIEYNLQGVTQGQINTATGFTFEKGMRSLLRQDPDIVMVGEIRDKQTAQIAIQAALTGHLVLSTVHTNDAPSVIMRLIDMGIKPFLINAALTGVLAQRLARRICAECKVQKEPSEQENILLERLGVSLDSLYQGSGCDACNGMGYKGRIGIFELLVVSKELNELIDQHPHFNDIVLQAKKDGMLSLLNDGIIKVKNGDITLEELIRIIS